MTPTERQRRRRARFVADGLTTHGTARIGRQVVSWITGPYHLPSESPVFARRCASCLGRIRPYVSRKGGRKWRHVR